MNCPYCLTEVKDGALICHVCKRDFLFFIPLLKRISELEDRVSSLETRPNQVQPAVLPPSSANEEQPKRDAFLNRVRVLLSSWWAPLKLTALDAFLLTFLLVPLLSDQPSNHLLFRAVSSVSALIVLTFVMALRNPMSLKRAAVAGLLTPCLTVGALAVYSEVTQIGGAASGSFGDDLVFCGAVFTTHLLTSLSLVVVCFSASWLGFWCRGRLQLRSEIARGADASAIVNSSEKSASPLSQATSLISGFAPIITLIGTTITAMSAYLAALRGFHH